MGNAARLVLLLLGLCWAAAASGQDLKVLRAPQKVAFPNGYNIVNGQGKVLKELPNERSANIQAYADFGGERHYMSDWSYQRYRDKRVKPNWIRARRQTSFALQTVLQQFDPDSASRLASNSKIEAFATSDNVIYLIDRKTGILVSRMDWGRGSIRSGVLSPDSKYLVLDILGAGGSGQSIWVYDISSGELEETAQHVHPHIEIRGDIDRVGIQHSKFLIIESKGRHYKKDIRNGYGTRDVFKRFTPIEGEIVYGSRFTSSQLPEFDRLQHGFWSSLGFANASKISLYAKKPDNLETFRPLWQWKPDDLEVVRVVDLFDLGVTNPGDDSRVPETVEILEVGGEDGGVIVPDEFVNLPASAKLKIGADWMVFDLDFAGPRGVGRLIDFGTWCFARNLKSNARALFIPDRGWFREDDDFSDQEEDYERRINNLRKAFNVTKCIEVRGEAAFNANSGRLICKSSDKIILYDEKLEREFAGHWSSHLDYVNASLNGDLVAGMTRVGWGESNSIEVYNKKSGVVVGRLSLSPRGAVLVSQDGNYMMRGRAVDGFPVGFKIGQDTYPFEQFDLRLNRPDIVLERLGAPAEAVTMAKELRSKRLKRMKVSEDMLKPDFHVPELSIGGEVPQTSSSDTITVPVRASDSRFSLERLKVYVNNVPVNGRDGESLRALSVTELERRIPVKLASGRNKIQISVVNSAGAESLYANLEVSCTAASAKPVLYTVALGVSSYGDPEFDLRYAAKDAEDITATLHDGPGEHYRAVRSLCLTDKEVTREALPRIREFLSLAGVNDTLVFYVAGHGMLDASYDYYYATADMDFGNPGARGIAFDEFDGIMAGVRCLRKTMWIDTCHAGELDEEERTLLAANSGAGAASLPGESGVAVRSVGKRGMSVRAIERGQLRSEWYERLQGLFVDLRRGSGTTVLTSSAGAEYAFESSKQRNGLFTYALIEALRGEKAADADKDGSITMSEAANYVKKRVGELSNGKQNPTVRRVNLEGDFELHRKRGN